MHAVGTEYMQCMPWVQSTCSACCGYRVHAVHAVGTEYTQCMLWVQSTCSAWCGYRVHAVHGVGTEYMQCMPWVQSTCSACRGYRVRAVHAVGTEYMQCMLWVQVHAVHGVGTEYMQCMLWTQSTCSACRGYKVHAVHAVGTKYVQCMLWVQSTCSACCGHKGVVLDISSPNKTLIWYPLTKRQFFISPYDSVSSDTMTTPRRGQPLYKGQRAHPQSVHYIERFNCSCDHRGHVEWCTHGSWLWSWVTRRVAGARMGAGRGRGGHVE